MAQVVAADLLPGARTMTAADLQGKVVLVTGASRGIGAAIARAFAAQGATVAVNYLRSADAAQDVVRACVAGGRRCGRAAGRRDRAGAGARRWSQRTVDAFGRLDVLVNNAFAPYAFDPERRTTFGDLAWPDYLRQFEGSVGAAFHLCQAALPHLRARAQGAIVNIVSDLVEDPVVPYHDYGTAKSALVGFSRQLAAELGPQGVRVNCVAPGLVHPTAGSAGTRASFREAIMAATPLRRLARPEDVAGPVVFLASAASGVHHRAGAAGGRGEGDAMTRGVLVVRHDSFVEVLGMTDARARAGVAADCAPQALARALRLAGVHAVLVLDAEMPAWLDAAHASGFVGAHAALEADVLAGRWSRFLVQGFVAADAALLALGPRTGHCPCSPGASARRCP